MALKNCRECGEQVSSAAASCPKCGAPARKRMSGCAATAIAVFVVVLFAVAIGVGSRSSPPSSPPPAAPTPEPTPASGPAATARAEREAAQEKEEQAFLRSKAGKVWKKHPEWSRDDCQTIADKKVHIGMSADQVRAAWGRPDNINSTVFGHSKHEQWVWGMSQYAYFEDGILTSIQQSH